MNKIVIKFGIVITLTGILVFMLHYKKEDGETLEKNKVTLVEKYFAPSQSQIAVGVKSKKEIDVQDSENKKCMMEFSNKKLFEVDCDKYLDFKVGDKVVIMYQNENLVKLGKK
jgi:hypothetical protein